MTKKQANHYVDNDKFFNEIVKYHQAIRKADAAGKERPRIPNYLGECIWLMAENLAMKPCFRNYSFVEEMKGDAIENCIMYFDRYDPDKGGNPFAYFTTVIRWAFIRRINKEEKARYTIYKNFQEAFVFDETSFQLTNQDEGVIMNTKQYDNINAFMERFEEKERIKREKNREKRLRGLENYYEANVKSETV